MQPANNDIAERFTPEARQALLAAQAEAKRLCKSIEPEQVWLGLIQADQSVAANFLTAHGVGLEPLQAQLAVVAAEAQENAADKPELSAGVKQVLRFARDEARRAGDPYIGTEHLLLGLLGQGGGIANQILQMLGMDLVQVRSQIESVPSKSMAELQSAAQAATETLPRHRRWPWPELPAKPSPRFVLLVLVTLVAGYLLYRNESTYIVTVLLLVIFVVGGWIVSLVLHEFAHAAVAYWGGDWTVADKGYLALDPVRYVQNSYSIWISLILLIGGGIGLPGVVDYINLQTIKNRRMSSLAFAAGPLVTALCALVLLLLFLAHPIHWQQSAHFVFWAGLALLAFLELTAFCLSWLPIPGLDGFGIIRPYLPARIVKRVSDYGLFPLFALSALLVAPGAMSEAFWRGMAFICSLVHLDFRLVGEGLALFQFWRM